MSDLLMVLIGENGSDLPDNLEHTQESWGMDVRLDGDCDGLLETLIHRLASRK
jgi:hypothetical protein